MSYIVASLPPLKCFVRREFLYNFTKGHGEYEPAIWVSLKTPSMPGAAAGFTLATWSRKMPLACFTL